MIHQLQNLRDQSAKLRRLSQPYFFPYTEDNGWQFFGLLVCLLFCVAGIVLRSEEHTSELQSHS